MQSIKHTLVVACLLLGSSQAMSNEKEDRNKLNLPKRGSLILSKSLPHYEKAAAECKKRIAKWDPSPEIQIHALDKDTFKTLDRYNPELVVALGTAATSMRRGRSTARSLRTWVTRRPPKKSRCQRVASSAMRLARPMSTIP